MDLFEFEEYIIISLMVLDNFLPNLHISFLLSANSPILSIGSFRFDLLRKQKENTGMPSCIRVAVIQL